MAYYDRGELKDLIGLTMASVENRNNEEIIFTTADEHTYKLYHDQDCCENVTVEDVCGDLSDLVGVPILVAEEATSETNPDGVVPEYQDDSFTWTFYTFRTIKGTVTIRWYGSSNGYYSESVSFCKV